MLDRIFICYEGKSFFSQFISEMLDLCNKILLLYSTILVDRFCYHGNKLCSRPPWYYELCWPSFALYFDICQWSLIGTIWQAYKYVRSNLWLFQMSFEHEIAKNNEIRLGRLVKSELRWEPKAIGVLPVEL